METGHFCSAWGLSSAACLHAGSGGAANEPLAFSAKYLIKRLPWSWCQECVLSAGQPDPRSPLLAKELLFPCCFTLLGGHKAQIPGENLFTLVHGILCWEKPEEAILPVCNPTKFAIIIFIIITGKAAELS